MIAESLLDEPGCCRRLEALIPNIDSGSVTVMDDAEVWVELSSFGSRAHLARGGLTGRGKPKALIAFTRGHGDAVFPGYSWCELRDAQKEARDNGVLCQSAVEIQSVVGCPFDCTYCPYGSFVCARLDTELFADQVAHLAAAHPTQRLFKLNNRSDTLGLEPEYGLAPLLVERFAGLTNRSLMLYSKGAEVESLVNLNHCGKTVACFTLTPEPIAQLLEPGAPPLAARLRAIERLSAAGYPIRVRLSPLVPILGWPAFYEQLLAQLLAVAQPELITLWLVSMIDLEDLGRIVPLERLDVTAVRAAHNARHSMCGSKGAPFPPSIRANIYREIASLVHELLPETPVALCLETPDVWELTDAGLVSHRCSEVLCNCGPRITPDVLRGARAQTVPRGSE